MLDCFSYVNRQTSKIDDFLYRVTSIFWAIVFLAIVISIIVSVISSTFASPKEFNGIYVNGNSHVYTAKIKRMV